MPGLQSFPAVADDVLILPLVLVVGLPLAAGGTEVAVLGLAAAADTWRVVGVVDAAKIAADLAATARDTCLVDPLMLGGLKLRSISSRICAGPLAGGGAGSWCGGRRPGLGIVSATCAGAAAIGALRRSFLSHGVPMASGPQNSKAATEGGRGGVAGIASIEGLRRVRSVNAVQLDGAAVENAVFVGLRRFGKENRQE